MAEETMSTNFIHSIIEEELQPGRTAARASSVHTRFPPEPNGYLHIGHCKALTIDFGTAEKYRRHLQPAHGRHQPGQGGHGVCGRHPGGHPLAGV